MRHLTDDAFWLLGLADQGRRILLSALTRMDDPTLPEIQRNFPDVKSEHVEMTLKKLEEYGWVGCCDGAYYPRLDGVRERFSALCMKHFGEHALGGIIPTNENLTSRQALIFSHYGIMGAIKAIREGNDVAKQLNMHPGQVKTLMLAMQKAEIVKSLGRDGSGKAIYAVVVPPVANLGGYVQSLCNPPLTPPLRKQKEGDYVVEPK
jgi:hypothetical protein